MLARYPVELTKKPLRQQRDRNEEMTRLLTLITSETGLQSAESGLVGLAFFPVIITAGMILGD